VEDNSHAGQGSVVLDIGGDIGALVITMPAALEGVEIEARPLGVEAGHDHDPGHDHGHGDGHHHHHFEHVAVVPRPTPAGEKIHSAVFAGLSAGTYELYERPAGPVRLTVEVRGGTVATAIWP
jgi:hypothetical protein